MRRILAACSSVVLMATAAAAGGTTGSADPAFLAGEKLVLAKRSLVVLSRDAAIDLGGGQGSAADPVVHGGSVRVLSIDGDVFDTTYDLRSAGWRYLKKKGVVVGYAYRGKGAVRVVLLRAGKLLRVIGRGSGLEHTLGGNPDPVRVVVTLGARRLCTEFEGTASFKEGKRFVSSGSPAPNRCPVPYGDDSSWLCRPGLALDQCLQNSLDTTVVHPDLTTTFEAGPPGTGGDYDCFYVYPTVDLSGDPGQHEDVTDPTYVSYTLDPLLAQAARFRGQCRIFAPHYRQITFATFGNPDAAIYQDRAYSDVLDAWRLYLKYHNGGRNVVIMAHSQGTSMTNRLIREEVDLSTEARAKLIVALLIGGDVTVPQGSTLGGSFENIPVCTSDTQVGCVIAFRSYAQSHPPTNGSNDSGAAGLDTACTNPAALTGGPARLSSTYFPTHLNQALFQIVPDPGFGTAFASYPDFYSAECVKDSTDHSYLEIRATPAAGDLRPNPIPFDHVVLSPGLLGTHILDWSWPMGDLLPLVATKAANMP